MRGREGIMDDMAVDVTGVDPIMIRRSLNTELVTAAL